MRNDADREWESPSGEECEPRSARRTALITVEDDMVCGGKNIAGVRVHPGPKQCQPRSGRWYPDLSILVRGGVVIPITEQEDEQDIYCAEYTDDMLLSSSE